MRYTVQCHACKRKRIYEGQTVGECMKAAGDDGWKPTGFGTQRVCKGCLEQGVAGDEVHVEPKIGKSAGSREYPEVGDM